VTIGIAMASDAACPQCGRTGIVVGDALLVGEIGRSPLLEGLLRGRVAGHDQGRPDRLG
jgi:hypothetical protein